MFNWKDLRPIHTKSPSYIKEISKSSENIYLVYKKFNKAFPITDEKNLESEIEDTTCLDLTGNPLAIDLSSDVSFLPLEENVCSNDDNHHPLPLNIARKIINRFHRESCHEVNSYIYCVCDGADKKCTLVLGAFQSDDCLDRTEIYNEGCFSQNDVIMNLEKLKQDHQNNISVLNRPVTSLITATYTVYGKNLRNYKISDMLPYSSCIMYNVSWNTYQYEVPEYVQSAEMTLQTVIGHKESYMHILWEQLMILQVYINILLKKTTDLEKMILTDSPKSYMEVSEKICRLLEEMQGIRKIVFRNKTKDCLDINNLRQENLSDKLWAILISCNNVGDLKICLHTLFEELAIKESYKPLVSDNNQSSIAAIINEISLGKLAVPTLSPSQSLQCLIELGIEKLKNDYFYILNHYGCLSYEKLQNYWSKTTKEYSSNIKCAPTKQGLDKVTDKRIRATIQPSTYLMDASDGLTKLNCLLKLHTTCSFLVLAEKAQLSTPESFNALVESLVDYTLHTETTSSKNISECVLEEITIKLHSNDVKFLQSKDPTSWNVRLESSNDRSVVTTIQHHSLKPIFPPCIYKYESPLSNVDGNIYYVTKMMKFTEKL